jgi:hypothetical protein
LELLTFSARVSPLLSASIWQASAALWVFRNCAAHSFSFHIQLVGVCLQRDQLISVQITALLGLVCLSDLLAFVLGQLVFSSLFQFIIFCPVFTMAFGSRISLGNLEAQQLVQSVLVNDRRWEALLGPFWPYLLAILLHMSACAMICFVSVYRRYGQYLRVRR